jgi:hypothetical protein
MRPIEINPGVVNGDVISDLLKLCNEYFISYMIQRYAGAGRECLFCGALEDKNGSAHHSVADCPIMKYQDIVGKHDILHEQDQK